MGAKKNKAKGKGKAKKSKGKDAAKQASLAPKPVKTGKGATPLEVAQSVAALIRDGASHEVEDQWLARGIESVEGVGASMAWRGKQAVLAKYRGWEADHEIHEMKREGPWVGATGFAARDLVRQVAGVSREDRRRDAKAHLRGLA